MELARGGGGCRVIALLAMARGYISLGCLGNLRLPAPGRGAWGGDDLHG